MATPTLPPGFPLELLANVPGMPPPPSKVPNFEHPEVDGTQRPSVIAFGSAFAAVTVFFCALRLYSRICVSKAAGWDDLWAVIATICALAYTGVVIASAVLVVDVHMWNVSALTLIENLPLLRAVGYVYFLPTLVASKIALATLFLRIFSPMRPLKIAIWAAIAFAVFVSFLALFWSIGLCSPLGLAYLPCSNRIYVPYLVASSLNIASDLSLLVIPLWGVYRLQMHRKRKVAISAIFLTGFSAVLASILGTYYRTVQKDAEDLTWTFAAVNILSMFEIDTTIIVACLPSLPTLFKQDKGLFRSTRIALQSIKKRLLSSNQSIADSIGKLRVRKSSRSTIDISEKSPAENTIFVSHEISQMEEGVAPEDRHRKYAPFQG